MIGRLLSRFLSLSVKRLSGWCWFFSPWMHACLRQLTVCVLCILVALLQLLATAILDA